MGKKQSKNQKRTSIITTLILLLLTLILLITSTYAWFTANQVVSINKINVHVDATNGLEISADGVNWKPSIDAQDLLDANYAGKLNALPNKMVPCSTVGNVSTNGLMDMFQGNVNADLNFEGNYYITSTKVTDTNSNDRDGSTSPYIAFDFFLKYEGQTGVSKDIYMDTDGCFVEHWVEDKVTPKNSHIERKTSVGLENAARVAFIDKGSVETTASANDIQSISGNKASYLWEPNCDKHTDAGIAAAKKFYGITDLTDNAAPLSYKGMKAAIPDDGNYVYLDQTSTNTTYFGDLLFSSANIIKTTQDWYSSGSENNKKIFNWTPEIHRIRCYMWIEGQDVDCEDNASGTDLAYNIQFTIRQPGA